MAKQIVTLTYWLGIANVVLTITARALNVLGPDLLTFAGRGNSVGYNTFLNAAFLFFATSIATASYNWSQSQK